MIKLVLAALEWLGFVDLSARQAVPLPLEDRAPDDAPVDGQIWIGTFVLTGAPAA